MPRALLLLALALAPAAGLAACAGDEPSGSASGDAPTVVATTTQVADLARAVAGDRAGVTSLLQPNTDPHDFEPRPSDVQETAQADVVLRSGGDIDAWMEEVVRNAGGDARPVELLESVRTIEGGHAHEDEHAGEEEHAAEEEHAGEEEHAAEEEHTGEEEHAAEDEHAAEEGVDPHWWQDPTNAERAVLRIRDTLAAADPEGRETYAANAERYVRELRALDRAIAACMRAIPAERRKLVTNHDALGYFAERYDVEVVGAVIPALTTQAQTSARELAELAETVREEDVRTIFPENALNPSVERALARETGARVGPPLYADALGPEGSPGATYLGALRFNANAMAEGFSGQGCDLPG
jgi:ABC-type Zn uptake system ZnuABC Zn-binding protein ZnuA